MSKDTVMTLKNLRKDILAMQIPINYHDLTIIHMRHRFIAEIDKTIKRKS